MRALLLGVLLVALLAPTPAPAAAPDASAASGPTELHLRNEIAIEGVLRYGRTVKVTRGTWNLTPTATASSGSATRPRSPAPPRQTYRLGVADVGQRIKARGLRQEARIRVGAGDRARRREGGLPRRGAPHGHLPDRDARPHHHQRPRVRPPGRPDVRRPARLAQRGRRLQAGQRPLGLLPGAGRGELAAALLERVQRAVELPRRPLRGGQPDAMEVRLTVVERRRQVPARLPQPRRQPRDRPLARPRPPRLPRARPPGAGDDAAVQGPVRLSSQPLAAGQRALVAM